MRNWKIIFSIKGFTLVELTIVLVIVALLIGGMLVPLSAQRDLQSANQTAKQLSDTREALLGFAVTNKRLPRPAVSATDGTERAVCVTEADCTGFIPWQVLGVPPTDAWGKLVRYSVSPSFSNGVVSLATVATKKIQSRDNLGAVVYIFGQTAPCNATSQPCAPAVVFSHGKSHYGTTADGTVLGGGTASSVDETSNDTGSTGATAGTLYMTRTPTDNTAISGGEFDDLVIWISPNILFNRLIAAGQL